MPDGEACAAALLAAGGAVSDQLTPGERVVLWATPEVATVVGLIGGLVAGAPLVPINPKSGEQELKHVINDARPRAILAGPQAELPPALARLERIVVDPATTSKATVPDVVADARAALVIYTSGTTGPPKGVVVSRAAIAANLDALAQEWAWTSDDVLAHALPLFHVHGLVLGTFGPLRVGSEVRHLGSFDIGSTCQALRDGATMLFGVPTMYHRLAAAAEADPSVATALAGARLLVSGSAPLAAVDCARLESSTGQVIVERYGMTETLMISSTPHVGAARPGYVGRPLPGVDVRVIDDEGRSVPADDTSIGAVIVRTASMMTEYLNQPEATSASFRDGWFHTGDLGVFAEDGMLRLVGRASTDLIKSGGYRIGAGEIEATLSSHPAVADVAVAGIADADLGQRVIAWVVLEQNTIVDAQELIDLVAGMLTPHKRPREVRFIDVMPRNAMGKVQKRQLLASTD